MSFLNKLLPTLCFFISIKFQKHSLQQSRFPYQDEERDFPPPARRLHFQSGHIASRSGILRYETDHRPTDQTDMIVLSPFFTEKEREGKENHSFSFAHQMSYSSSSFAAPEAPKEKEDLGKKGTGCNFFSTPFPPLPPPCSTSPPLLEPSKPPRLEKKRVQVGGGGHVFRFFFRLRPSPTHNARERRRNSTFFPLLLR